MLTPAEADDLIIERALQSEGVPFGWLWISVEDARRVADARGLEADDQKAWQLATLEIAELRSGWL